MMTKRAGLIGFADDRAVANNNGRPGAAKGPEAFRTSWEKLTGRHAVKELLEDHGDAAIKEKIEDSHAEATATLTAIHRFHELSVVIGGGHDYAYAQLAAIREFAPDKSIACINIDPHFDMRKPNPFILSGSPFYMAIRDGIIRPDRICSFGIGEHCNGPELWEFALKNEVELITMSDLMQKEKVAAFRHILNDLSARADYVVVSLDLDSVQAAHAPGVSAPAAYGFTPEEIYAFMRVAGLNEKCISLGIYELNPRFDIDHRTSALAALALWNFMEARFFE